jgi:hypothetical protein
MAMVWIALLGGGDYAPEGLTGFGELFNLSGLWRPQLVVYRGKDMDVYRVGVFSVFSGHHCSDRPATLGYMELGNASDCACEEDIGRVLVRDLLHILDTEASGLARKFGLNWIGGLGRSALVRTTACLLASRASRRRREEGRGRLL